MSKNVKVRGIYATAMTEFLKSNKFNIADASEKILERIDDIENDADSADNLIYDKEDLNGITIHGEKSGEIIKFMKKKFKDSLFRRVESGSIYCGIISKVDQDNKSIHVDLGKKKEGLLSLRNFWGYLKEGEKVLVQIKGETDDNYMLSTKLRLFGNSLILIKDGFMKVSKHVRDEKEIQRLENLSKEIDTKGWGILWKSLAENKSDEELIEEINGLLKEEEKIIKEFEKSSKAKMLNEGICIWFVDFGKESKYELDKIREKVTSTIKGHHLLKSSKYSDLVDFVEELKTELPKQEKKILGVLDNIIFKNSPEVGQTYRIFQKKANGRTLCAKGTIEKWDKKKKELTIKRVMRVREKDSPRTYDGLEVEIADQDYIITKIVDNANIITHEYFDVDGNAKGKYISITTNIELLPRFARAIDLEIDVVEIDGKLHIIDEEELKFASELGAITESTEKQAMKIAQNLKGGN